MYEKSKTSVPMLPQPVGWLKVKLNLFCIFDIQGREFCLCDFMRYTLDTGLHWEAC